MVTQNRIIIPKDFPYHIVLKCLFGSFFVLPLMLKLNRKFVLNSNYSWSKIWSFNIIVMRASIFYYHYHNWNEKLKECVIYVVLISHILVAVLIFCFQKIFHRKIQQYCIGPNWRHNSKAAKWIIWNYSSPP